MNVQNRQQEIQSTELELPEIPQTSRSRISVLDFGHIAATRFRVIMTVAAGFILLIAAVAYSLRPLFTAEAVVMVQEQQTNVVDLQLVLSGLPTDEPSMTDQIQILQSRALASKVVSNLRLDRDPEFNKRLRHSWTDYGIYINPLHWIPHGRATEVLSEDEKRQLAKEAIVDKFLTRLKVSQVELSTSILIDFTSEDPGKAARIADAIAEAYVEDQLNAKFDATQRATQWLGGQLQQLAARAREAEAAAVRYRAQNHITDVPNPNGGGIISVLDQQIGAINAQLVQARSDKALAQAALQRVRSLVSAGRSAEVSQVVNSPLIAQLRQQEATLAQQEAQMASRYGPDHPKMKDLKAAESDLNGKIDQEIAHVVTTVENDVSVASAKEASLLGQLKSLEHQSTAEGQARVRLAELESNATSSRALYDTFIARSKQTQEQQGLQLPDARIISRSAIPEKSSFPNFLLVFGLGTPIALIFGFTVAFVLERLDRGFRMATRVEETLGLPVLATVPDTKLENKKWMRGGSKGRGQLIAANEIVNRPLSSYAEAIRGLQMGLNLSNVDRVPKVVLVTSAVPGEGKTTVSLSLARHAAQAGQKVVLVECDLRRPNVAKMAGALADRFDVVDVLRGACQQKEATTKDPLCSLDILPAVKQVKNAPDLLGSNALIDLVETLRGIYDLVVLDSAPILPVNDTKVLTRVADTVLFVVRWDETPRDAVIEAIKALRDIHAPIAGVVLTRADTRRLHYYSYGYVYGGYYGKYAGYYQS